MAGVRFGVELLGACHSFTVFRILAEPYRCADLMLGLGAAV